MFEKRAIRGFRACNQANSIETGVCSLILLSGCYDWGNIIFDQFPSLLRIFHLMEYT